MLNVSNAVKTKYLSDEYTGNFKFIIGSDTYTSSNMVGGSIEIEESLCSTNSIQFSATEKSSLKVRLGNLNHTIEELQGKKLIAYHIINGEQVPLGEYNIVDCQNKTVNFIEIEAYDNLQLLDRDVSAWWNNNVVFPVTVRDLLISLLTYCGVSHNIPSTFTNSTYLISQNILLEGVTGLEVLGYIQEISACFIKPDRTGTMRLVKLPTTDWSTATADFTYTVPQTVSNLEIADYLTERITKVQVRGTADDVGIIVGTGSNTYVIEANPLLTYIEDSATDIQMITNILNDVQNIQYRPFSGTFKGLPYIEIGDMIRVNTITDKYGYGVLLHRVLFNSGLRRDKIEVKGTEKQESVTRTNRSVQVLKQQTHEFVNTVSELRSTITEQGQTLGNTVTGYTYYWLVNDGDTPSADDSGWSTNATLPWAVGKSKWQKIVTHYVNRDDTVQITNLTEPNMIDIETWYFSSISDTELLDDYLYFTDDTYFTAYTYFTEPIDAEWTKERPTAVAGRYIWTRFKKIFSDGTETWTDPVCDRDFADVYALIHTNSTSIVQTNEEISLVAQSMNKEIASALDTVGQINQEITTRVSELETTSSGITSSVSKITERIEKAEKTISEVDSKITQTEKDIRFDFNTSITNATNNINDKLNTYFEFGADGLTIGKNTSQIKSHFSNTQLYFADSANIDKKYAWIGIDGLGTPELSIGSFDLVGNRWKIIVSEDGSHLTFTRRVADEEEG